MTAPRIRLPHYPIDWSTMHTRRKHAPITTSWTVQDVLRYFPTTILVFHDLGIDTCCGVTATIEAVAREVAVRPEDLLAALEARLAGDAHAPPSWMDRFHWRTP